MRWVMWVCLVVLGGLVAGSSPRVFCCRTPAGRGTAEAQMSNFGCGIEMYFDHNGRLPATLESLLQVDPSVGEPWLESVPKDPWGHAFRYATEGLQGYRLTSVGADGEAGTSDDLTWAGVAKARR